MPRRLHVGLPAGSFLALLLASGAFGHLASGSPTLYQLVTGSELIVRARILDADAVVTVDAPPARRPALAVEVLEVLKGAVPEGPLRFVRHGHGLADYADGEEALVFLVRIERSAELAELGRRTGVRWVSFQDADAKVLLTAETRAARLEAARAYLGLERTVNRGARIGGMGLVTVSLLGSPDPRLASWALGDLVRSRAAPLVGPADVPKLEPLVWDTGRPIGLRIGLLAELERRGLVAGPVRWARLLRGTRGSERLAAVRAAGNHPSPAVQGALLEILAGADPEAAAAAALSLGVPGHPGAVAPLAEALQSPDARLRNAAIRALGRVASPEAHAALEAASTTHPDADTRRRAGAEVRRAPGAEGAARASGPR